MIVKLPQRDHDDHFYWVNPEMVVKLSPRDEMRTHDWSTGVKLDEPVRVLGTEVELITPYGPERLEVRGTPDEVARMLEGTPAFSGIPVSANPTLGEPNASTGIEWGKVIQGILKDTDARTLRILLTQFVAAERDADKRCAYHHEVREAREWMLGRLEMILGGSAS